MSTIAILDTFKNKIEVTKPFYEIFRACVSDDPTRYFMNHVYYDQGENMFIATDGRRMIKKEVKKDSELELMVNIESGYFAPAKIGKKFFLIPEKCDYDFVNWKRVIPDNWQGNPRVRDDDGEMSFSITNNDHTNSRNIFFILRAVDQPISLEYISVLKHVDSFEVIPNGENRAIVFDLFNDVQYIVMPMQK